MIGAVAVVVLSALALALRWYSQSTTMGSPKAERQLAEETAVLAIAAVVLAVAALDCRDRRGRVRKTCV